MKNIFKKNGLFKLIGIVIALMVISSWLIPSGSFVGKELVSSGLVRVGFESFFNYAFSILYNYSFQIIFLLVVGGFYGILTIIPAYRKLVTNFAKCLRGDKISSKIIIAAMSLFIAVYVSFSNDILPALVFVPFIISVILKAKHDKIIAFSATFGSIFVGLLGATYSHFAFDNVNYYIGTELQTAIWTKALIFGVAYAVLMLFTFMRMNATKSDKNAEEDDLYAVSELTKKEQTKLWPLLIVLTIVGLYAIIGYINWNTNFEIEIFKNFNTWLLDFKLGKYNILAYILGMNSYSKPLGELDIYSMAIILLVGGWFVSFIYRVKFDECFAAFLKGVRKIFRPVMFFFLAYVVFSVSYQAFNVPTIANAILNISDKFNPFLLALIGVIAAVMNVDHGFTAHLLGSMLVTRYATNTTAIMLILNTTYGLTQFIAPSGILLFFGLSYLGISYKSYWKFIWKYLLCMLLILLLVYANISL